MVSKTKERMRKEWNTHDKLYHKLKFRGIAEKRGRKEGTPDVSELEFVNGTPAGVPKKSVEANPSLRADANPYSRREPGQRRLQGDEPSDSTNEPTPAKVALRSYEIGKIPMVCFEWKHGNNCPFSGEYERLDGECDELVLMYVFFDLCSATVSFSPP